MLDLLAQSSGPAASFRVIALFDTEFNLTFQPGDVRLEKVDQDPIYSSKHIAVRGGEENSFTQTKISAYGVNVYFEHSPAFTGIFKHMKNMEFMYTIELFENTGKGKKEKIQIIPCPVIIVENMKADNDDDGQQTKKDGTGMPLMSLSSKKKEFECLETITNLEMSKEYTIRVNTIINGKILGCKTESFGPLQTRIE